MSTRWTPKQELIDRILISDYTFLERRARLYIEQYTNFEKSFVRYPDYQIQASPTLLWVRRRGLDVRPIANFILEQADVPGGIGDALLEELRNLCVKLEHYYSFTWHVYRPLKEKYKKDLEDGIAVPAIVEYVGLTEVEWMPERWRDHQHEV